eukprot:scaffold31793_cov52-Phaeocystis_antarctica.AAC.2
MSCAPAAWCALPSALRAVGVLISPTATLKLEVWGVINRLRFARTTHTQRHIRASEHQSISGLNEAPSSSRRETHGSRTEVECAGPGSSEIDAARGASISICAAS